MRNPTLPLIVPAAFALACLPLAASAQSGSEGLSYTFLEADYINVDVDSPGEDVFEDFDDGDGWAVRGSLGFLERFFVFADYSVTDSDATVLDEGEVLVSSSQDLKRFDIGLGVNLRFDPPVIGESDLVLSAAYADLDFDDFNFGGSDDPDVGDLNDDSSDGYFLDARVRSQLLPWLEGSLGARYTDIEDADDFSAVGGVLLEITQNLGVNLEFQTGSDTGFYLAGLRWSFMPR